MTKIKKYVEIYRYDGDELPQIAFWDSIDVYSRLVALDDKRKIGYTLIYGGYVLI